MSSPSAESVATSVAVGVLTYQRPRQLAALLPLLARESRRLLEAGLGVVDVRVVVVDNDPAGSAGTIVSAHDGEVEYHHEPARGISHARNRALDAARPAGLLVFIDDDETPVPGWLSNLVRTSRDTSAVAVAGRVVSEPDGDLDPFVAAGGFLDRAHRDGVVTGTPLERAATNNLLLDLRFVETRGLRFDPRFGLTGGEDSLFTSQLVRAGGRLVWCAEAVVIDHVTVDRMTPEYMLRRARAMSSTDVHVGLALRTSSRERLSFLLGKAVRELLRAVQGSTLVLRSVPRRSLRDRARGRRALARARGAYDALRGRRNSHYAHSPDVRPALSGPPTASGCTS